MSIFDVFNTLLITKKKPRREADASTDASPSIRNYKMVVIDFFILCYKINKNLTQL